MPNIKSAIKRAKQTVSKTLRNKSRKSELKTEVKKLHAALASNDLEQAGKLLSSVNALTARAKSKGLMHPNTASRRISRLAKKVSAAQKSA